MAKHNSLQAMKLELMIYEVKLQTKASVKTGAMAGVQTLACVILMNEKFSITITKFRNSNSKD